MIDIGLVVLRGTRLSIEPKLFTLFQNLFPKIRKKLYVKLDLFCKEDFFELMPLIYLNASIVDQTNIDLRVLLNRRLPLKVDCIFKESSGEIFEAKGQSVYTADDYRLPKRIHHSVVLGGTFDRLHNGHKVLLSTALLLTDNLLTCGVTTGEMNMKKKLWELIEPVERRCDAIVDFVSDISDAIEFRVVPITDPFGPSIVDPEMECIVVSEETIKGGHMINDKRAAKGLNKLTIHPIKLIEGDDRILDEAKVSSSTKRCKVLGTMLREPKHKKPRHTSMDGSLRYVIGLTGGIASGKSHIAMYLSDQGCELIDCDKLAHELYRESADLRQQLCVTFGANVLEKNGAEINRQNLGAIVFGNKEKLNKLNGIVWPLIAQKMQERISMSTRDIVVVDAAVMIEAGWDEIMDQIWTTFVPNEEAIKRICERDKLSVEQAEQRINSQISNVERISHSNVTFCTLWEYAETERQVQRALDLVNQKYFVRCGALP